MIVFGKNESRYLRDGWHEREVDGRVNFPYRSTMQEAGILLHILPHTKYIFLLIAAPVSLLDSEQVGTLSLLKDQSVITEKKIIRNHDQWNLEMLEITGNITGEANLKIKSNSVGIPDKVLHNGDQRKMGWMVSAIWQHEKLPSQEHEL